MTSEAEIGEVAELWRYPVGSVGGETVELLKVNADQVVGDRIFRVVRLGSLKAIFGAHVYGFASLLDARAVLDESRNDMTVTVVLPDGDACRADDPEAGEWLSRYLGRPVQLLPTKASWAKESSMIAGRTNAYREYGCTRGTRKFIARVGHHINPFQGQCRDSHSCGVGVHRAVMGWTQA